MKAPEGERPTAKPPNIRREILLKLSVIVRQMRKSFEQRAAGVGITRSQWSLIAAVVTQPGATQREIAEALQMSEASAGRLIDRLCVDGLLERRPKEDDRRAYSIYVTDRGGPLLKELSRIGRLHEAAIFADVTEAELDQLSALLDKVCGNLAEKQRSRH